MSIPRVPLTPVFPKYDKPYPHLWIHLFYLCPILNIDLCGHDFSDEVGLALIEYYQTSKSEKTRKKSVRTSEERLNGLLFGTLSRTASGRAPRGAKESTNEEEPATERPVCVLVDKGSMTYTLWHRALMASVVAHG